MKASTLAFSGLFIAANGAIAWLWHDNSDLRNRLDALSQSVPAPDRSPRVQTAANSVALLPPAQNSSGSGGLPPAKSPGEKPPAHGPAVSTAAASTGPVLEQEPDGSFTLRDPVTGAKQRITAEELEKLHQTARAIRSEAAAKRPHGPAWSPGQAAGEPNTETHGDHPTAWASQRPDNGAEWLHLKYARAVEIKDLVIHETYNPGAISKVTAMMPDGSERTLWEGVESREEGPVERVVNVPPGIRSDQIRIHMDTARVPGWNEIDAVQLNGRDGSRQWAAESTASSYYGQDRNMGSIGLDVTFTPEVIDLSELSGRAASAPQAR